MDVLCIGHKEGNIPGHVIQNKFMPLSLNPRFLTAEVNSNSILTGFVMFWLCNASMFYLHHVILACTFSSTDTSSIN